MSMEIRLRQTFEWRCYICRRVYDPEKAEQDRVTAALFGLSDRWCPWCIEG